MKNSYLIPLSILVFAAAAFGQSDKKRSEIESAIKSVMNKQMAAWNRGDIDSFMQGYWNSEKLVFVSGDNVTRGWQPTLDRYKKSYDSREKMGTLTFAGLDINVLSGNDAVVLGSWSLQRSSDNPKGKFTLIFRRLKDAWRIVHDHTS